jgi:putative phage-type endonuclease
MTTPEHDYRRHIGATDSPALLGLHPYKSPHDVWARIVEGRKTPQNKAMLRGLRLEPVVREMYLDETGAKLLGPERLFHPAHDWLGASLDDRTAERVVEFKTASLRKLNEWGEEGTDEVPPHYLVQVQHQMLVSGLPAGDLAVLLGGDELRIYQFTADLELQSLILETCERFQRNYIETKLPPPVDDSTSCAEWLKDRYSVERGPILQAGAGAEAIAQRLLQARAALEAAEVAERGARNELIDYIKDAAGIEGNGWRVSYKSSKGRATLDVDALCSAHGIDATERERYTKRTPYRVFRLTDRSNK